MENYEFCAGWERAGDGRFALKGAQPQYTPDRTFETEHIKITCHLNLNRQVMKAQCESRLRAIVDGVQTMTFDAVNFHIEKVMWNGRKTGYSYKKEKLTVKAPKPCKENETVIVTVFYRVEKPKMGLFFLKPDRRYPRRPWQVWTQGQDEYARYWFPCVDFPGQRASTEVVATVPRGFTAISNGKLLKSNESKKEKTATFHWRLDIPHAPYLVSLAVGKFSVIKDKWKKVPILYYCEKGREKDIKRSFGNTPKMMEFFSKSIGVAYPYPKYSQVAVSDFIYGGMENTSATTQTDTALLDKRAALDTSSDELVAHELAHQWFGDYLTCKSWSHAWLNESFATYFDALFKGHHKGQDEFLYAIYQNSAEYFSENKEKYSRPLVTHIYKSPTDLFDRHLYEKGSVVLSMLHHILGEQMWWKSINTYVRLHKGQTVETTDLINAIEKATGRNMRRFFDQWVFGAGHPVYHIRMWVEPQKKEIHFRVVQTNGLRGNETIFNVNTAFLVETKKGLKRFPVQLKNKSHHFQFKLDSDPLMVQFDPDHRLLKRVEFPRAETLLLYQLKKEKNILGRIEAAYSLAQLKTEKSVLALRGTLVKNGFWGVRVEVARALGSMGLDSAGQVLVNSLDVVDHPKVRTAIYRGLTQYKSHQMAKEIEKRYRKEASYFATANGLHALGALRHPHAEDHFKKALDTDSWNQILRIAALSGLAELKSSTVLPLLLHYTKKGQHQRVRMAAIRSLTPFGFTHSDVQNRLVELLEDDYLLVKIAAAKALHDCGDERVVPALKKIMVGDLDGRLKRTAQEAVEKITKGFES